MKNKYIVSETYSAALNYNEGNNNFNWIYRIEQILGLLNATIIVIVEGQSVNTKLMNYLISVEKHHNLNIIFK